MILLFRLNCKLFHFVHICQIINSFQFISNHRSFNNQLVQIMAEVNSGGELSLISEKASKNDEESTTNLVVKPSQQFETSAPEGYKFIKTIGDGSFGKVKLGIHILTQEKVAIKILCKQRIRERTDIERISRQIKIMKLVRHPFLVQMFEIIESPKYLFLIMEYIEGGDLFDEISNSSKLSEEKCKKIFSQISLGLEYLHNSGITHRDMKPQNILIEETGKIKIADFGLGNFFTPDQKLKTACGSPCYAPPEMLNQQEYNPRKVDIWSSGIILYAMVHGYLPFEDDVTSILYEKIKTKNVRVASWVSIPCRNLLRGLLAKNQNERWDMDTIKKHEFLYQQIEKEEKYVSKETEQINLQEFHSICEHLGLMQQQRLLNNLKKNKHNNLTTLFYLGKKKYFRQKANAECQSLKSSIIHEQKAPQPLQEEQKNEIPDENRNIYSFFEKPQTHQVQNTSHIDAEINEKSLIIQENFQKLEKSHQDVEHIEEPIAIPDAPIPLELKQSIEIREPPKQIPPTLVHGEPIASNEIIILEKKDPTQIVHKDNKIQKLPTKSLNSPPIKKNITTAPQQNLKKSERLQKKEQKAAKISAKGLKKSERMPIYKPKQETNKMSQAQVKLYQRSHSKDRPIILKNNFKTQSSSHKGHNETVTGKVVHIQPDLLDVERIVLCSGERFCEILQNKGFSGRIQYYRYQKQAIFIAKTQLKFSKAMKGNPIPSIQKIISEVNQ